MPSTSPFAAKLAKADVDHVGAIGKFVVPDMLRKHCLGQHPGWVARWVFEHPIRFVGEGVLIIPRQTRRVAGSKRDFSSRVMWIDCGRRLFESARAAG